MTHDSLLTRDWQSVLDALGGTAALDASARQTKAFQRARGVASACDLLRLILAYCLSEKGLRLTAAWASAIGLADISNVALRQRLRRCGDWLALLVGHVLTAGAPPASRGRLIRILDATAVPKAGATAARIHSAFELPSERFGWFELTDQTGAEQLDRIPVVAGEIRIADRAYLKPDRLAAVIDAGADVVVRASWRSARWLDASGQVIKMPTLLHEHATRGMIDQSIRLARNNAPALCLRLVAVRKPPQAAEAARHKARREAQREGYQISPATLVAAEWVILVTSLSPERFCTAEVLALYRLRWRIELGFKRLKSVVGLKPPPGRDERSARPWLLAHLLAILLLEPLVDELEDSPRWAIAA